MSGLIIPFLPVIGVVIGYLLAQLTDFGKKKKRQTLDTLINEEALLLAKFLRSEHMEWNPRHASLKT